VNFGDLVTDFFQRKNNVNCRFPHKLYNALKMTRADPFFFQFLGVAWICDSVMKVDKLVFAQLLGIKSVDGALFHLQGNFPSHGFVELTHKQARLIVPPEMLRGVDYERVRLMMHQDRVFVRDATEETILNCTWVHARDRVNN
jgi:hypothetical protein